MHHFFNETNCVQLFKICHDIVYEIHSSIHSCFYTISILPWSIFISYDDTRESIIIFITHTLTFAYILHLTHTKTVVCTTVIQMAQYIFFESVNITLASSYTINIMRAK